MPVDVKELGCDFYVFSAHKMGSPSGVGVLYGKKKWLEKLAGGEGGGDMAKKVTFESFEYAELPKKFEAGTMPFVETIAFGAAIDYVQNIGMKKIQQYELELLAYAEAQLSGIKGLTILGQAAEKESVISFIIKGVKPKKLETYLSEEHNISIRCGDLTAQPLMEVLGVKEVCRVSLCYYNTYEEIDYCVQAIQEYLS